MIDFIVGIFDSIFGNNGYIIKDKNTNSYTKIIFSLVSLFAFIFLAIAILIIVFLQSGLVTSLVIAIIEIVVLILLIKCIRYLNT